MSPQELKSCSPPAAVGIRFAAVALMLSVELLGVMSLNQRVWRHLIIVVGIHQSRERR